MVGSNRALQVDLDALPGGRRVGAAGPRRRGVAVDGVDRATLRGVGERVTVAGGPHRAHPADLGHGSGVVACAREHREGVVGGIGGQRGHARLVHLPEVVAEAAPALALQGVGVGEDQDRPVGQGLVELARRPERRRRCKGWWGRRRAARPRRPRRFPGRRRRAGGAGSPPRFESAAGGSATSKTARAGGWGCPAGRPRRISLSSG